MNKKYDYIIVGTGLFGATFAHQAKQNGCRCLIIDRRKHTGGNVYCENMEGINVHKYGPHVFHTNNKRIWDYVNSFVPFNRFTLNTIAFYKGKIFNLPFNMHTFHQMWGVVTPEEAKKKTKLTNKRLGKRQESVKLGRPSHIHGWQGHIRNPDSRLHRKAVGTKVCGSASINNQAHTCTVHL